MKNFIRIPYEEESAFTAFELKSRLDSEISQQRELSLYKLKGTPLFLVKKEDRNQYALSYHHAYKKDMCDTCVRFTVEKGLERCRVSGFICKPAGTWAVFWGIAATLLIDFLIITYCILFAPDFNLLKALMISFFALVVRAYVCLSVLRFNSQRLEEIKLKMADILGIDKDERNEPDERN